MNAVAASAGTMVLLPRFDPEAALRAITDHSVTVFCGVPTMYIALLNQDWQGLDLATTLRVGVSGGAALPVVVLRAFEERFGVVILEGYGLSETSPVATFNHFDTKRVPGSIGVAITGTEVGIMDEEGRLLGDDEPGEIVVRGHNVMKGYWGKPEATAQAIRDGWFHTGDIGKRDADGNHYIVDRLKDMVIRGGFNVYPREIEEVLMQHPAVAMVAVVGVPHEVHGEEIKAVVLPEARHPGRCRRDRGLVPRAHGRLQVPAHRRTGGGLADDCHRQDPQARVAPLIRLLHQPLRAGEGRGRGQYRCRHVRREDGALGRSLLRRRSLSSTAVFLVVDFLTAFFAAFLAGLAATSPSAAFAFFAAAFFAGAFVAAFLPKRPRAGRAGAAARIARHSSSVSVFGSRSFGILPFFSPSVM
jgi:ABC-type amino acid transport system permease subunit